ncbi:MAG: hypothetical protein RMJ37_03495 [Spirochaetia bacterium]|nr:hypothetical protein [Spirochaetota bacterium]MDW8112392.1 hypothetical protein [Spirochaetia bacterium]
MDSIFVLNDKASGIGSLSFEVVGGISKEVDIVANKQVVYSKVKEGFKSTLNVISGIQYTVEVVDSADRRLLASGNILVDKGKRKDLVIEGKLVGDKYEVRIVGAEFGDRRLRFEVWGGSLGLLAVGVRYMLSRELSVDFGVGDSFLVNDATGKIYNKVSVGFGGRYVFLDGDWGELGLFNKLYGSYYGGGIRNVGLGLGLNYSVWMVSLDIGMGVGMIGFSNFSYGMYWGVGVKF